MEMYDEKKNKNLNWLQVIVCSRHQRAKEDYDAHSRY